MKNLGLIAGVSKGPTAAVLASLFVLFGIIVTTNGAGRWDPRLPMVYRVGGGFVVIAFGIGLVVHALT